MDHQDQGSATPPTHSEDEALATPPSEQRDSTYSEPASANVPLITPEQRKQIAEKFPDGAKKRVKKATDHLAQLRCVISNSHELYGVQYAHILPRAIPPQILDKLEYSWGMKLGTLHVDSRYNVIRLNVLLHTLFDSGLWILMPERHILDAFFDRQWRPDQDFRNFVQGLSDPQGPSTYTYKYTFVPARDLCAFEIRRYSAAMNTTDQAGSANFDSSYYYPFANLPTISSHVHPHFVICNIGLKMKNYLLNFFGVGARLNDSQRGMIERAMVLFERWTADIPAESNFYRDPYNPAANNDDNDSACTIEGRMDTVAYRRSLRTRTPATPSNKSTHSRKRARGLDGSDAVWLDDETLRILDEDASPGKRLKRKTESVSAWISSISEVKLDNNSIS